MFDTYEVSVLLNRSVKTIVEIVKGKSAELADQLHRAAISVTLNIAEGARSIGGNKLKHYAFAQGSANEVKACVDLAETWGWLDDTREVRALLDRQLALLWKLTHPRRDARPSGASSPT